MRVSIFGLGYIGCILTGCLSRGGHEVTGVDINPRKVREVDAGRSPIEEPGVEDLIADGVAEGRVRATTDAATAVQATDLSMLTVGTPLDDTGQLNTTNLYNVVDSMLPALHEKDEHTVVVRSTAPPGTTRNLRQYLDAELQGTCDVDVLVNPEFLREGSALDDFRDPPYVVVGEFETGEADELLALYDSVDVQARTEVVDPELAESLKLVNNAFHALKICFANEVGSVASRLDTDGKALMELVCADRKLNISSAYLEPGFAFGGACLPKDTRAISTLGDDEGLSVPLLDAVTTSNDSHLDRVREAVDALDTDAVGIAGVSFKSSTTDLRNSPGLRLARLLETDPLFYADGLDLGTLVGANRDYVDKTVPDAQSHFVEDPGEFLDRVDAVVFTNDGSFSRLFPRVESKRVVDPVGAVADRADGIENYRTVTW